MDVVSPTGEEVRELMEEFTLDPLIAEELMVPSVRNRVDARDDYFYAVFHFPTFKHLHDVASEPLELDFIVGKKWIITARYVKIDPLHQFSKLFEIETILNRKEMGEHAGNVRITSYNVCYTKLLRILR